MVDISVLLSDSGNATKDECTLTLIRIRSAKQRVEAWYKTELEPLLAAHEDINGSSSGSGRPDAYPDLLFAVQDCVASTILLQLEYLGLACQSGSSGLVGTINPSFDNSLVFQQVRIAKALDFVKQRSPVAMKTLEFGLRRICPLSFALSPSE
jgi:hypothetical protein